MNLRFFFAILLCFFKYLHPMPYTLKDMIREDNVETFQEVLDKGLKETNIEGVSILSYSLMCGSNKIAKLAILNKINDLNTMVLCKDKSRRSPLGIALTNPDVSTEIVQLLLDNSADIYAVWLKPETDCRPLSVFHLLKYDLKIKNQFITDYLMNYFGENTIPFALILMDNAQPEHQLIVINQFVTNGAIITDDIVDKAKKNKIDQKIIDYLQHQIEIRNAIKSTPYLPTVIGDLIAKYSYGPELNIDEQLLESICSKDINFIKNYLKSDGNPNYNIKVSNLNWSIDYIKINKIPILWAAVILGAEDIAKLLIENGAEINSQQDCMVCKDSLRPQIRVKGKMSILYMALSRGMSLRFIKEMLNRGADIDSVNSYKSKFRNKHISLIQEISYSEDIPDVVKSFLLHYFYKRFGENILDYALEKEPSLEVVKSFVSKGAKVTRHIVEKAQKFNNSEEIVKYLNGIYQLEQQLKANDIALPRRPVALINDYYCIEDDVSDNNESSSKCVIC